MSNHLGDTNKMVDTPRTDAEYERLFGIYQNAERINGPLCCAFENDMRLCGQLERELNAANQRIKRLEEMYEGVIGEQPELLGSNVMGLLKRELNFAQKRIKRLEEAGDNMVTEEDVFIRLKIWTKAKDYKL